MSKPLEYRTSPCKVHSSCKQPITPMTVRVVIEGVPYDHGTYSDVAALGFAMFELGKHFWQTPAIVELVEAPKAEHIEMEVTRDA